MGDRALARVGWSLSSSHCTASASDVDGDSVSLTYTWSDGSTGTTYAVTDADDPGDAITCTVRAAASVRQLGL